MSEEKLTRAAIVTGGSRGIGRAVCVALAKQGCNVVVNYCHGAEPAEQTAALCRAEGVQAVTVQADVSTAEGCKALFDAAAEAFGRVDVLVNNAGITRDNLILRLTEQDFEAVLDTNLKSAFLCCKEAARRMVRQLVAYDHRQLVRAAAPEHQIDQIGLENDVFLRQHLDSEGIDRTIAVLDEHQGNPAQSELPGKILDDPVDLGKLLFIDLNAVAEHDGLEILARKPRNEQTDQNQRQAEYESGQNADEAEQPNDNADHHHESVVVLLLLMPENVHIFHTTRFLNG